MRLWFFSAAATCCPPDSLPRGLSPEVDEGNKRVKTDGLDAKALCLKLDRFVQGNCDALAMVRVPSEEEERSRAIDRQRERLVGARKRLEAQGRSLLVNHGLE